jgi:hypothetical protein
MRGMTDRAGDPQALTVLTTEHFVPQTARSGTIGEANGRASIYLGALSSALIAPGFTSDRPAVAKISSELVRAGFAQISVPLATHRSARSTCPR